MFSFAILKLIEINCLKYFFLHNREVEEHELAELSTVRNINNSKKITIFIAYPMIVFKD